MKEGRKMEADKIIKEAMKTIRTQLDYTDEICDHNQKKVLQAFIDNRVSATDFSYVSGYGHDDCGREKLDRVFAQTFDCQNAIVRNHFVSGTHAIACAILGNVKYSDSVISLSGKPYDTMEEVLGTRENHIGSLINSGVNYKEIDLLPDGQLDFDSISKQVDQTTTMVLIQRSCGYSLRPSINVDTIKKVIQIVKNNNPNCICFVDNCYGEFVEGIEPSSVGADIIAGSLIKNPGGGIVETGGYVAGKEKFVKNAANRLTAPGIGEYGGSMLNQTRLIFQGLFMAPSIVANAVKSAILASKVFEMVGFESFPKFDEKRTDIIQKIKFQSKEELMKFCETIQHFSPIDSYITPVPDDVPGYDHKLIMAGGSFIEGSTIELSCDAPLRKPFVGFLQGALSFSHSKIVLENLISYLI